ncbi:asparagine synthase (glutamine-hydrolyzing) [Dyella monticola]|uniref:asparagine synthase (glutamine-hydrolyzing) n=1 Tax=Dyella monticola TaxID=1927958 RepID=A0A370X8C4_9GAMM|nr:asparagine synthase (glutamine-hydrolyzing) [Dyella monticola]RDS84527.1 asparagine synthase (glutamine-hydrolyzing) [Dyella monticola]
MCGIAGLVSERADAQTALARMLGSIRHRGPDDIGMWSGGGLLLGHLRLSIVDLTAAGHQPMISNSGNLVLVYNGEIYNSNELREEIGRVDPSYPWRGHSDTEVLLACIERWGVQAALQRCNGMFALALWDKAKRTLTLARDRMGEKPLYFGWPKGRFAFASELKALCTIPDWSPRMHAGAISCVLSLGYVRGAQSAIDGIYRLPPASMLTLNADEFNNTQTLADLSHRIVQYWSLQNFAETGLNESDVGDEDALLSTLSDLLHDAVAMRMTADVPIGAFLSGGIDSSLVTAIMQQHSTQKIQTFCIGFDESSHNEANYARVVAEHIGSEHTDLYLSATHALDLVPRLATIFDEPFADSSQLPTLLVSELARKKVKVVLSGDGGDELFAGYGRYASILQIWKWLNQSSFSARHVFKPALSAMTMASHLLTPFYSKSSQRLERLRERTQFSDIDDLRLSFIAGAGFTHIQSSTFGQAQSQTPRPMNIQSPLRKVLFSDQADYLPDNILHKVDRATMAYSLEARVPLLDHRIVELSWHMRDSALFSDNVGKRPLRKLLRQYVPASLVDRPKQGFAPPITQWLRGPLRDWAETLLSTESLRELPLVDVAEVQRLWRNHLRLRIDAGQVLWNVLMLCSWRSYMKIGRSL